MGVAKSAATEESEYCAQGRFELEASGLDGSMGYVERLCPTHEVGMQKYEEVQAKIDQGNLLLVGDAFGEEQVRERDSRTSICAMEKSIG